jgi:preprotein translocase subunit SecG
MEFIFPILLAGHILVGATIIGLVLLQHGKGADMGAAFGSGASGSLFGASGSANFLSRTTAALAAVFFFTSLALTWVATNRPKPTSSIMDSSGHPQQPAPVTVPLPGPATPPAAGGGEQAPAEAAKPEASGAAAKTGTAEGAAPEGKPAEQKATEGASKPAAEPEPKPGADAGGADAKPADVKAPADKKAAPAGEPAAAGSKVKEIPK